MTPEQKQREPCEICGKLISVNRRGRFQHSRVHDRPTAPDASSKIRFEKKFTIQANGCWQWHPVSKNNPYGQFCFAGRQYMAFMFSWWLYRGQLVKSPPLELDHLCLNKGCVNPDHLEPVTRSENCRRAPRRFPNHCPKGHKYTEANTRLDKKNHRYCRACESDWRAIHRPPKRPPGPPSYVTEAKNLLASGLTASEIARLVGVSRSMVSRIHGGSRWKQA